MHKEILKDRIEAGQLLTEKIKKYKESDTVVLAIPRGGVPIGYLIAKELHLPLDIVLSKKIGHPNNKEYAIGAVSLDSIIINEHVDVPDSYIDNETVRIKQLLIEKYKLYRGNKVPYDINGRNVILVDDGIATGNTLLASIAMLRKRKPLKIIVAVPVLPYDMVAFFKQKTDEFIYLIAAKNFRAVGQFYQEFNPVEEEEVIKILNDTTPN